MGRSAIASRACAMAGSAQQKWGQFLCVILLALSSLCFQCSSVEEEERIEAYVTCRAYDILPCWQDKSVYQIVTDRFARSDGSDAPCTDLKNYCGGSFKGIMDKLDYIEGLGVDAIWISPIVANVPGGYHGYWARSLSEINPHFGTHDELLALVNECHRRGLLVMVDVVANHMGQHWSQIPILEPFNDPKYYHDCSVCQAAGGGVGGVGCNGTFCDCWVGDYNDRIQEEYCQLYGLPDLNQSVPFVKDQLMSYARNLTLVYGIDALRIDTAPYVANKFWKEFDFEAGLVFSMGEVSSWNDTFVHSFVKKSADVYDPFKRNVFDSIINYPLYYAIRNAFIPTPDKLPNGTLVPKKKTLKNMGNWIKRQHELYGDEVLPLLGNFIENHDNPRLSKLTDDIEIRKSMILFVLANRGISTILYGQEQDVLSAKCKMGNPGPGEFDCNSDGARVPLWETGYRTTDSPGGMYEFIAIIHKLRNRMPPYSFKHAKMYSLSSSDDLYVFQRGQIVVALTNGGSGYKTIEHRVSTPKYWGETGPEFWQPGTKLCSLFQPQKCNVVDEDGELKIIIENGQSELYAPELYVLDAVKSSSQEGAAKPLRKYWPWLLVVLLLAVAAACMIQFLKKRRRGTQRSIDSGSGSDSSDP